MCAIVGINSINRELSKAIVEELLIQSQIRGKHATGVAYVERDLLKTKSKPIPAKEFVTQCWIPFNNTIIGHCRYSTSSIEFNQPISDVNNAIVHNGIITQESPEDWRKHFNYSNFSTHNDSELILKSVLNKDSPFQKFPEASMAVGLLNKEGRLFCFRNFSRPLYLFRGSDFCGFASTRDIIKRTFDKLDLSVEVFKSEPFKLYELLETDFEERKIELPKDLIQNQLFKIDQQ